MGVAAEILLLLFSRRLLGGLSSLTLLWMGGLGAAIRWTAAGFVLPVESVYVLQTLHAASFALTHLAVMRYLENRLPTEQLPLAYAANGALIFGPAMALASFAAGLAYDALAPGGITEQTKLYWLMVLVTLGGLALAWRAGRPAAKSGTPP
jgi:PPP family 3-phenylpropionic acid transporter